MVPDEDPLPPRVDVGEVHGWIAAVAGVVVLLFGAWCCAGGTLRDNGVSALFALVLGVALWSGLFGLVTGRTTRAPVLAGLGLAMLVIGLVCGAFGVL